MTNAKEKRNRRIEASNEAKALKRLRELRSLSVRDVGDLLDVSFTTVSHMENGRAVVHEEYLKKFLKALKFTNEDYEILLKGKPTNEHLKLKCYRLIDEMELSKLEKACGMLSLLSLAFVLIHSIKI